MLRMQIILAEFEDIILSFPQQIIEISATEFEVKLTPGKWSKKEILGHLIDSAFVNYSRFIQAQFEENPQIYYNQEEYCQCGSYQDTEVIQLCNLWHSLNKQLLFLFKQIISKKLVHRTCNGHSLEFLMQDYVVHLKHHRNQILA